MPCDCNKTNYACNGVAVSSDCVVWRGGAIPALGICPGDPLTFVELQIIDQISDILDKEKTQLEDFDITTCPALSQKLAGQQPDLAAILQVLWTNQCSLTEAIETVNNRVDEMEGVPYAFQTGCITPAGGQTISDAILQGVIYQVCDLKTQVTNLVPSVDSAIETKITEYLGQVLKGLGNRGITQTTSGSSSYFTFTSFVPPYCPLPYYGPISNFDATGKGLTGTAYEGWYLLSGYNGVPDARGRTLVAGVKDVPGPAMDTEIDPTSTDNPNTNYISGQKFGNSYIRLTVAQMPSHTHKVTDPGHTHSADYPNPEKFSGSKFDAARANMNVTHQTGVAYTGISLQSAGGGEAHDNRQPSLVVTGYIMRID